MEGGKKIIEFETHNDGVDLKKIFRSFWNSWPVIFLFLLFWVIFGVIILRVIPPVFQLKSSILIEEPQRINDPYRYTLGPQAFNPPDDEYFVNEKIRIKSIPLVEKAIDSLGLNISYYAVGLRKDEIYKESPFVVELGEEWLSEDSDLLFNYPIDVGIGDDLKLVIEADGEAYVSKKKIDLTIPCELNEEIQIGKGTLRIKKRKDKELIPGSYAFKIQSPKTVLIEYIDKLDIQTEELNATIMGVYINGQSPQKQMDFLNALGEIYIQDHLKEKRKVYMGVKNYVDDELNRLGNDLENKEKALADFKETNKVSNLSKQAGAILNRTSKLENEQINLKVRQKYYDYLKEFIQNSDNYEKLISPQAFKINDPVLLDLTSELVQLQLEKNHLKVGGNDANPSYQLISSKIEAIKVSIIQTVDGFNTSNEIRLDDIEDQIRNLELEANEIPEVEREYIVLERNYMLAETAFLSMMEKKVDSDIAIGSVVSDFKVIEPAHLLDTKPFFPNRLVIIAIVLLLTFLSVVVYMIYKLAYRSKISSLSELGPIGKFIRVDGVVDYTNLKSAMDLRKYNQSYTSENFRSLMLKSLENLGDEGSCICVSSFASEEGKSFITAGLANALAESGKKVLIVDSNKKKPSQAKLLNSNPSNSLSNYINKELPLKDCVFPGYHENVALINAGDTEMLMANMSAGETTKLFKDLKKLCDFLIIDTSAIGIVSTGIQYFKHADRILLVYRRNVSENGAWEELRRILSDETLDKTGLVFNGDIDKYSGLSRKARKYYKNKGIGLLHSLRRGLSKV